MAYRDIEKVARQIVLGFGMFLVGTYTICLHSYEEFLHSLQLGVGFNIMLSPLYYSYFGD